MPTGKLRHRAGIISLAHADANESEVTLAAKAAREVLENSGVSSSAIDWIIAASETHHAFPSFAAQMHLAIGVHEKCGALDVGGACLGLLHALAVAKSFVESGQSRAVLVVTADVHSRALIPGCASQLQAAIQVSAEPGDRLKVVFDGDALSRAATARLDQCISELERVSGIPRTEVAAFATHQPNPRLVALLAKKSRVSLERFPPVAAIRGNLGSTTCAAALHSALEAFRIGTTPSRAPIFLASLGPGLLYGGGWLAPE